MLENALVTVIVTTYKGADSIERAVESVLNQTYPHTEVIVVDDNGMGTEQQIQTEKLVKQYQNVTYIAHETNQNGSNARNTGAKVAKGEFLCFLDDDDEFLPEKISLQIEKFKGLDESYGLVYCSFEDIDEVGVHTVEIARREGEILRYSLLDQVKVATSLFMVRKSVFDDLQGFDGSFRRHQDWEFVARLTSKYKVSYVEEICVIKHSINRNLPQQTDIKEKYRMHYLNKLEHVIALLGKRGAKKVYCYHYLCFVKDYVKQRNIKKFFEYMVQSKAPFMYCGMFLHDCAVSVMAKLKS